MRKAWKWIATGLAAIAGAVTLAFLWRRGEKKADRATRELAQARLDGEAELALKKVEEAKRTAEENVEHGMAEHDSLADFVNDRTGND